MAASDQPRRKLSHGVKERLHTLLESGELRPGDFLPSERDLMRLYQVGRPAIREAMQALERGGLVTIRHGGRARVAEPALASVLDLLDDGVRHALLHSPDLIAHLKEARLAFEVEITRRAAKTHTDDDIRRLRDRIAEQDAARDDPARFLAADGAFHREIAAATRNPVLVALAEAIFRWLRPFHDGVAGREQVALDEHAAVVDAIEKGRRKRAARAMVDHLTRAHAVYEKENHRPALRSGHADPAERPAPKSPGRARTRPRPSSPAARAPARAARSRGPRPSR